MLQRPKPAVSNLGFLIAVSRYLAAATGFCLFHSGLSCCSDIGSHCNAWTLPSVFLMFLLQHPFFSLQLLAMDCPQNFSKFISLSFFFIFFYFFSLGTILLHRLIFPLQWWTSDSSRLASSLQRAFPWLQWLASVIF